MRYDYPGGVLPEERPLIERFEYDVLPFVEKHGPEIGERALQGDLDCEEIIRRHHLFVMGIPEYRPFHYRLLRAALKRWQARRSQ